MADDKNIEVVQAQDKFDPDLETIAEFLERFSLTYDEILENKDTKERKKVSLLIKSLPRYSGGH